MRIHANRPLVQRHRSRGIGLVTAIFLLVVLAALAVAIASLSSSQQLGAYLDVQGSLAYQAARTGGEVGAFRVMRNNSCPATSTFAMPADSVLSAYTVTVVCSSTTVAGVPALTRFVITSTACNQPSAGGCPNPGASVDYVQRVVEVRL